MGGEATMITDATRNVLIESAWFDPASIRRTARRLGMHTDASHRYERGADCGITQLACARVAELIVASRRRRGLRGDRRGGAHASRSRALRSPPAKSSAFSAWKFLRRRSPASCAASVLPSKAAAPEFTVTVPTWRLDVEREIDLIEEVARIYSYLKIPSTLPSFAGGVVELPNARKQAALRGRLLALGYNESLSSTFIPQEDARFFSPTTREPVRIANPLSEEASFMRTSLVPGLLSQIAYNLNRGNADVRLFEAGHVYAMQGEARR